MARRVAMPLLLILLAACPAANAARVPADLGTAQRILVSDGVRFAIAQPVFGGPVMRVLDFRTGRRTSVSLGPCGVQSMVRRGPALLNCMAGDRWYSRLFDPATMTFRELTEPVAPAQGYSGIGRQWAFGAGRDPADPGRQLDVYTNWHDGRQVFAPRPSTRYRDLDDPDLKLLADGEFPENHTRVGRYRLRSRGFTHVLETGRRTIRLGGPDGGAPQLTSRAVTWSDDAGAHAVLLPSLKRRVWPRGEEGGFPAPVVQVGRYVVYGTYRDEFTDVARLHAAPLRRGSRSS